MSSKGVSMVGMGVSRRSFIARAGAAAAMPWLVPASALGRDGAVAPSNRIVVAGIGLGGRGQGVMRSWVLPEKDVQFVAICDVWKVRRDAVKNIVDEHYGNKDCKTYIDMRELLARPDIDVIHTATGDRWHAGVSIAAMKAGKDVYTEKPASMTVREGQAVVATAAKYNRVYQAGMQRLSEPNFVVCNELLRLGRLGEVKTVYAHLAPGGNLYLHRDWLPAEPLPDNVVNIVRKMFIFHPVQDDVRNQKLALLIPAGTLRFHDLEQSVIIRIAHRLVFRYSLHRFIADRRSRLDGTFLLRINRFLQCKRFCRLKVIHEGVQQHLCLAADPDLLILGLLFREFFLLVILRQRSCQSNRKHVDTVIP